ncbi:unnamed protein product [Linum tenue]|uniref:Longin domain-containing protein n=1 Tax=Linum tenue TaxID=586396 RepID=A0AAV0LTL0_9ROSI|nr:unnamed protein product [Linum tenue]
MAILYAVVARGTVVLAEFSAVTGNTGAVARRIMEKLPADGDTRMCFSQDRFIFHILRSDGLIFLCMANDAFGSTYSDTLVPFFLLLVSFVLFLSLVTTVITTYLVITVICPDNTLIVPIHQFKESQLPNNPNSLFG